MKATKTSSDVKTPNFMKSTASTSKAKQSKPIVKDDTTEKTKQRMSFSYVNRTKASNLVGPKRISLPASPQSSPLITITTSSQHALPIPKPQKQLVEPTLLEEITEIKYQTSVQSSPPQVPKFLDQSSSFNSTDTTDTTDTFLSNENSIDTPGSRTSSSFSNDFTDLTSSRERVHSNSSSFAEKRQSLTIPKPAYMQREDSRTDELRKRLQDKSSEFSQKFESIQRQLSSLSSSLPTSTRSSPGEVMTDFTPKKTVPSLSLSLSSMKRVVYEETVEGAEEIDYLTDAKQIFEKLKLEKVEKLKQSSSLDSPLKTC